MKPGVYQRGILFSSHYYGIKFDQFNKISSHCAAKKMSVSFLSWFTINNSLIRQLRVRQRYLLARAIDALQIHAENFAWWIGGTVAVAGPCLNLVVADTREQLSFEECVEWCPGRAGPGGGGSLVKVTHTRNGSSERGINFSVQFVNGVEVSFITCLKALSALIISTDSSLDDS